MINGVNYSLSANDLCLYVVAYEYDEASQNMLEALNQFHLSIYLSIYLGHFPQFVEVADNTKENNKHNGVLLRSSSNDEGPGRVSMALLKQHSPPSPVFHNLRRFTDAISPTTELPP